MEIQTVDPVKLFIGVLYPSKIDIQVYYDHLKTVFGCFDEVSDVYDFDFTDYYQGEIGDSVSRQFISVDKLISPDDIVNIKLLCNQIEQLFSIDNRRHINLDPGYMDLHKLVLASAKYGRQKIYMNGGIYADPTLFFHKKEFHAYDWSFPDFSSGNYNSFFISIRNTYKKQLNHAFS